MKKRTWYWVTLKNSSLPITVWGSFAEAKHDLKAARRQRTGNSYRVVRVTEIPIR